MSGGRERLLGAATKVTVVAPGRAFPKGSKDCLCIGGRGVLKDARHAELKAWQERIRWAATAAMKEARLPVFTGACEIRMTFTVARGTTVTRALPTVAPDWDKLARAVCDALQTPPTPAGTAALAKYRKVPRLRGPVYDDDAQIVDAFVSKRYATAGDPAGVVITVTSLDLVTEQLLLEGEPP